MYSSWNNFPTKENPTAKYKFGSFEIKRKQEKKITIRATYNILDWLGDWGGLMDALIMIGNFLVAPFRYLKV